MSITDINDGNDVDYGNTNSSKQFWRLYFYQVWTNHYMCIKSYNPINILIY